ncbi:MAG: hypothetical protein M3070_02760 [Actinomycetota bacterium]|nr:hypothetical protein [Actinomycetota bacterium]
MRTVEALQSDDVTKVGVGAIIVLLVVGVLVFLAISALIARVVVVLVVVGLGLLIWQQRSSVEQRIKKCEFGTSFVGIHVQAPDNVIKQCKKLNG